MFCVYKVDGNKFEKSMAAIHFKLYLSHALGHRTTKLCVPVGDFIDLLKGLLQIKPDRDLPRQNIASK